MIKLNASFSKKVPGAEEYSSEGYMCAVELELSDTLAPEALNAKIHETFGLVRASVESELDGARAARQPVRVVGNSTQKNGPNGNGKASNRQLKYLLDLANDRGISLSRLNARLTERYGAGSVYDLTRGQASEMLDDLKKIQHARAA